MKTKSMGLLLVLLAGAATGAMAQERQGRPERDRPPAREGRMERPSPRAERPNRPERQAWSERQGRPEGQARPERQTRPERQARPERQGGEERRRFDGGERQRPDLQRPNIERPTVERRDGEQRRWERDGRRFDNDGRRDDDRRWDRDGRRDDRRGDDRRWDGRRDGDRRWEGRRDDRRWDNDRRRPPTNHPRWEPRRYPPIYTSPSRFRGHIWRPPVGFYSYSWGYGDILPRGWYDDGYRLHDWWNYGLPVPPPGLDWVRVGYDAILVDEYTGQVFQVVRMVFW
ncbi:RcnB family protein [Phenylobacterium sp.]|jgi:hypothetical protein|uniref:RcnB family protein n=1 Tax=Phenylobacterium sp. TaxID=1871053 RepID=UPI003784EB1E